MDCGCLPRKHWKSDTKMIWGGPIFSVSVVEIDDVDEDNLWDADELSWLNPDANAKALNPLGYSQHHTLAHVAAGHEAVIAIY